MSATNNLANEPAAEYEGPGPLSHIEDPAVVLNLVDPAVIPNAPDVLAAFEQEVYGAPRPPGEPSQFRVAFANSAVFGLVAVMVFPRTRVDRLAAICAENGLVLVRGVLTAINVATKERITFDVDNAVAGLTDTRPATEDVYTFGTRRDPAAPRIVCGYHDWDLPAALGGPPEGGNADGAE